MNIPNEVIGLASHYIGECFDIGKPLLDYEVKHTPPVTRFVTAQLYIDNVLTGESILILLSQDKFWDAEVLLRTIVEGSLKFIYILENKGDAENRAVEYYHVLTNNNSVKRSHRLQSMLSESDLPEEIAKVLRKITISEEEQESIRNGNNKADRKNLENKWSFHGLLNYFSNLNDGRFQLFKHLSYQYGMASHLIHKDGDAVGMIWERSQRSDIERESIKTSQSARIISDLCQCSRWRLYFLFKFHSLDMKSLEELDNKYKNLFDDLTDLNKFDPSDFV